MGVTAQESSTVRDALARLRMAQDQIAYLERRMAYLERDKRNALARARRATDQGRYWHGVASVIVAGLTSYPIEEQKLVVENLRPEMRRRVLALMPELWPTPGECPDGC